MSLDWNLENIEDYENICWEVNEKTGEKYMNPITHSLIFATISVGISEITQDNVAEFYNRTILTANVYGEPINEFPEEGGIVRRNYTFEEVKQHIGLSTNASHYSDKEFMEKVNNAQAQNQKDLEVFNK